MNVDIMGDCLACGCCILRGDEMSCAGCGASYHRDCRLGQSGCANKTCSRWRPERTPANTSVLDTNVFPFVFGVLWALAFIVLYVIAPFASLHLGAVACIALLLAAGTGYVAHHLGWGL